jgi:hypothetical protein
MTMKQGTIAARVMIQANSTVAQLLFREGLSLGRLGWRRMTREREQRMSEQDDPWRLEIENDEEESITNETQPW